jgi:hypothetical protein
MPKVFISYSWNNQVHQNYIEELAQRLISDGVDVLLDVYDLKEGQDKFTYMESMVSDEEVNKVLIFSDKNYTQKADSRKAGVGTESQIISQEIYGKVKQEKFIPIVCEFDSDGNPYLPLFLKSRIWIDFSSLEKVNENWEKLIRVIFEKPLFVKPPIGHAPAYLEMKSYEPMLPQKAKLLTLIEAIKGHRKGINLYRDEFTKDVYAYIDKLRVRREPNHETFPQDVMDLYEKLKPMRDLIIDWLFIEVEYSEYEEILQVFLSFVENILELKSRPEDVNSWNDQRFEAHALFIYELFLYIIALLIKTKKFILIHEILTSSYMRPKTDRNGESKFCSAFRLNATSESLQRVLAPEGRRLYSPAAELVKRNSDRSDISFENLKEADLTILLMAILSDNERWYPQLQFYSGYDPVCPLFLRATQKRYFRNIKEITGIDDAIMLKTKVLQGIERLKINQWEMFNFSSIITMLNIEEMDSIK